uniref:Fatty acid hydroxylase domain-containing protein n=1 Tax=Arcella intermedia TaxID=1963864 RepID=A0A6B2LCL5_9EUKA
MLHNIYYAILGCFQWTVWEIVFLYGFVNGRLPVVMDSQLFSSWYNIAGLIFWILFLPIWRDVQFYFVHRFIHVRPYYKFVHSLHHRNVYPEPFSGIAMHPIEHLMYIVPCLAPSLYFGLSPLILLWNGVHLMTSPAGAHSGYEDIFMNEQLHHIHHATFNTNFGGLGLPLDLIFGTFKPTLNQHKEAKDSRILFGPSHLLPGVYQVIFNISTLLLFLCTWWGVTWGTAGGPLLAAGFTLAPPAMATALYYISKDKMPISWPFQQDPWLPLHLILGLLNLLPIYHIILAIAP